MSASKAVFKKIHSLAPSTNLRFVSINRRGYDGSTPLSDAENGTSISSGDDEKADFLAARGVELINLIDLFIEKNDIPPVSADGKCGGIAIVGWSAGINLALAAVANIDKVAFEVQSRLSLYMRALIMQGSCIIFLLRLC